VLLPPALTSCPWTVPSLPINSTITRHFIPFSRSALTAGSIPPAGLRRFPLRIEDTHGFDTLAVCHVLIHPIALTSIPLHPCAPSDATLSLRMLVTIWFICSAGSQKASAFTLDRTGGNLPAEYGPWPPGDHYLSWCFDTDTSPEAAIVAREGYLLSLAPHPIIPLDPSMT
jgi:hypothetical protein